MIIDGVFASQAIDSSGEELSIEGCDISTLDVDGVANYEHKEGDKKDAKGGNNGEEIVGKIIYAKKIFNASDCDTEREELYWKKTRVPFIYGMVRLFDGAGHEGAKALAAIIRDHHANNEPILVRFSIEGSTLERDPNDKNRLKESVARRVALTLKPCNRTAVSGLLEDPRAPEGFDKKPEQPKAVDDLLSGLVEKGESLEHPAYTKLGGVHEFEGSPLLSDEVISKLRLIAKAEMLKAITAGSYGTAPGNLEGGAALQKEHLQRRLKEYVVNYKPKAGRFDKAEFKAFAKTFLPEADDSYIDHFADIASDYHAKKLNKAELAKVALRAQKKPDVKAPKLKKPEQISLDLPDPPLSIQGKPVKIPNVDSPVFDEQKGVLHTPRGSFPMYIPSRDKQPGAKESFDHILHDPHVNKFHDAAMKNWVKVNKLLKSGRLPPEVIMHAALFAQLSPNTPVPMQELMYGHLVDSIRHTGLDPRTPAFGGTEGHRVQSAMKEKNFDPNDKERFGTYGDWKSRDTADKTPQHSPEHWERIKGGIRLENDSKKSQRKVGQLASFMLANNKFQSMSKYHILHDQMVQLVDRHKDNARAATSELMQHKKSAGLYEAARERAVSAGKPDPGPYSAGPVVGGLAPKTSRYMYGMMGGGNVQVPDTHFVRYLFGLGKGADSPSIEYLKNMLWNEGNSHILEGIDRYYAQHHDAVKHMMTHPKWKGLFEKPEDAIFPSFWKNWVAINPHERARGFGTNESSNEETDHRPYWEAIDPFLKSEDTDAGLPMRTAMLHAKWVKDYGEMPALAMYYTHLVPKLMAQHYGNQVEEVVRKFESLYIDFKKAESDQAQSHAVSQPSEAPVEFAGLHVIPGCAKTSKGELALLHEGPEGYVAVEKHKLPDWDVEDLMKLPHEQNGSHYLVTRRPAVPVGELENK